MRCSERRRAVAVATRLVAAVAELGSFGFQERRVERLLTTVLCVMVLSAPVFAGSAQEPILIVLPALMKQVNSEMEGHRIPWFQEQEKYAVKVAASFSEESTLVKTVKGDYSYTLYRFMYKVDKLLEGELPEKELMFYVERQFPTHGSGIKFKELWSFHKDKTLIFKLRRGPERFLIVSIEQ